MPWGDAVVEQEQKTDLRSLSTDDSATSRDDNVCTLALAARLSVHALYVEAWPRARGCNLVQSPADG